MSTPAKFGSAGLNPELKSWIDNVIVPALVKDYLAAEDGLANRREVAANSPQLKIVKP